MFSQVFVGYPYIDVNSLLFQKKNKKLPYIKLTYLLKVIKFYNTLLDINCKKILIISMYLND